MESPLPSDEPGDPPRKERRDLGRNLPVAIASGLALATVFIGSLVVSPWAFLVVVFALIGTATLELDVAFRTQGWRPATPVVIGATAVLLFGTYANGASAQSLGLVLLLLGAMTWTLFDRRRQRSAASLGVTMLMGLWLPFLASYASLMLARPEGMWYVLAAVALSVTNDIGAFGFGSGFGKRKLAPSISPAKSWEGTLGGYLTVLVVAGLITARLPGFELTLALVFGLAVALASTIGDLAESLVKRDLGVKDLGRIVPGHGGIMDRADAIIFALPAAHLVLLAFGL
jgi:phosphatidate cytidylyltransferase